MEGVQLPENLKEVSRKEVLVHYVLSHAYMMFFLAVIFGVAVDQFVHIAIIPASFSVIGIMFMVFGSLLVYWAQSASSPKIQQMPNFDIRNFSVGPYKYSRNPTHIGLAFVTLGFGIIMQSFFIIVFLIIAYTITKLFFIKKEEKLLEAKYGEQYIAYKKKVTSWL